MSRAAEVPRPARSIVWSIFGLVLAAVLTAAALFFIITFSGPPPMDPPRRLADLAVALRDGVAPRGPGPPLKISTGPARPVPRAGEIANEPAAARMAAVLRLPGADAVAYTSRRQPRDGDELVGSFTLAARIGPGWRAVQSPPTPFVTRWHWATLAAMVAMVVALSLPAWLIARAISRPLRRLAVAAEHAQAAGAMVEALPARGSREVVDLARAVQAMHARLANHAEGRTAMLAAIAHDLGTPLSRLAFWVEQLPESARLRANADIDEMRSMIAATLGFARDEAGERPATRIDLGSLLDSLVEDVAVAGTCATLSPGPRVIVRGDAGALRRLFANLVENAVRYGDRADLAWTIDGKSVVVTIDDVGSGIDPAQAERLFEPFVRGDPSRNRATGGTGLGLAIVRSIAIRHGGAAMLANRPGGGARATVRLPLSEQPPSG